MSKHQHWPTGDIRSFHLSCDQLSMSETSVYKFEKCNKSYGPFHILNLIMVLTIFTVSDTVVVCNFLIRLFVSFSSKFKFPREVLRSFGTKPKAPIIMDIISNF